MTRAHWRGHLFCDSFNKLFLMEEIQRAIITIKIG